MIFQPGALVRARNRDWVVQSGTDSELILLKPLGGSDEEVAGYYLPLQFPDDKITSTEFPKPTSEDLGDISSARLLYNATRLAFRSGAGPFRSLAKLSFRPRSYQMVPLIMALKQEKPMRLFIADDVGVGKTIEAILILKELLERREITSFAIVALPHLCEQWQAELKDKFGIEAVIIRSNTQARLDRAIQGDTSIFKYYPFQVISIDYIKSEQHRKVFVNECPELIIVDEVHTCAEPSGQVNSNQQQRHALVRDIAAKKDQNLILLTATPHSGKPVQFQSLISLIDPSFHSLDLPAASHGEREKFAKYYVQRRRGDVLKWMQEETPFPKRDSGEEPYEVSEAYHNLFSEMVDFALGMTKKKDLKSNRMRMRYWSALALLRGIMSSPAAGMQVIGNRLKNAVQDEESIETEPNPIIDDDFDTEKDYPSAHVVDKTDWTETEIDSLKSFSNRLQAIQGTATDAKAYRAGEIIERWIKDGFHPVIFCRYIATANYLGEILKKRLTDTFKDIDIQVITSEDPDEIRKTRIDDMGKSACRVLVATDCLSEGINLQDKFTAVLHYDLPWNPNRLEQREGRIDRFGQPAPLVKTYLFYGTNNPIDGVVLKVLLRKVQEIRKAIGISIPFPEDSKSLLDSVLQAVLFSRPDALQTSLDFGNIDTIKEKELEVTHAIDRAADRETASRSIFAQHAIKAEEIESDLHEADESIGNPATVEKFVNEALNTLLGVQIERHKKGYMLYTANLPENLKITIPPGTRIKITFYSPVPEGYYYIGRNHAFVEQLCQNLMAHSMKHEHRSGPARAAVIRCKDVDVKTTLLLFRVRNVIQEREGKTQLVAEEMLVWGYAGNTGDHQVLTHENAITLMENAVPTVNISIEERRSWLEDELKDIAVLHKQFDEVAIDRSTLLIESHERFRKAIGGKRFKVVEPVLPMDLMGVYILLPDRST